MFIQPFAIVLQRCTLKTVSLCRLRSQKKLPRKSSILVREHGSIDHAILKTTVLLESRFVAWKFLRAVNEEEIQEIGQNNSKSINSPRINPWKFNLGHRDVILENLKTNKHKKMIEITKSKRVELCEQCKGSKTSVCHKNHSNEPDECCWCRGTGKGNGHSSSLCSQCKGAGLLECKVCNGTKNTVCSSCKGSGSGVYVAILHVRFNQIEMEPIPLSQLVNGDLENDNDRIRLACVAKSKKLVSLLDMPTESTIESGASHRAQKIFSNLTGSKSHFIQLDVPQTHKNLGRKKSASNLRSRNIFRRNVPLAISYYLLSTDEQSLPYQLTKNEFARTVKNC